MKTVKESNRGQLKGEIIHFIAWVYYTHWHFATQSRGDVQEMT